MPRDPESPPDGAPAGVVLRHGAATDVGLVRAVNEDAFLAGGHVYAVADGMGGHRGGDVASRIAVEELEALTTAPALTREAARDAVRSAVVRAQRRLREYGEQPGANGHAGTTVVVAVLADAEPEPVWVVAHLGDSRLYAHDADGLRQVTRDHSVVQGLLDAGVIGPEDVAHHPERAVVTRALTALDTGEPDFAEVPVATGLRLVLCSDGVSGLVPPATMASLTATGRPQEVADLLVSTAVAAGGHDNATAVVVDVVGC